MELSSLKKYILSPWMALISITIVAAVIYSNIYRSPFVFDDIWQIEEKLEIRDPNHFFSIEKLLKPRAAVDLTFALNYIFGGLNVFGYHLTNVLIHIINSFLAYLLSLMIFTTIQVLSVHQS